MSTLEPTEDRVGIFTNDSEKIASVGLHMQRRISSHGFVLNVDSRCFPFFEHITACGLQGVKPTSIQQEQQRLVKQGGEGLQVPLTAEEVAPMVAKQLGSVLGRTLTKQDAMEEGDAEMDDPHHEVEHQTPGYRPQDL